MEPMKENEFLAIDAGLLTNALDDNIPDNNNIETGFTNKYTNNESPKWCPCCGAPAIMSENPRDGWQVTCQNSECGLSGKSFGFGNECRMLALHAWNRRSSAPKTPFLEICPNCGSVPTLLEQDGKIRGTCEKCGLSAPFLEIEAETGSYDSQKLAADKWNELARLIRQNKID